LSDPAGWRQHDGLSGGGKLRSENHDSRGHRRRNQPVGCDDFTHISLARAINTGAFQDELYQPPLPAKRPLLDKLARSNPVRVIHVDFAFGRLSAQPLRMNFAMTRLLDRRVARFV
jgi:hypothetical protein